MKTPFTVASLILLINFGFYSTSNGLPLQDDTNYDNGTISIKKVQLKPNQTIQVEVVLEIMTNNEGGDTHIGDPSSVAGLILQNYLSSRVSPLTTPEPPVFPPKETTTNIIPSAQSSNSSTFSTIFVDDDEAESINPTQKSSPASSTATSNYVFSADGSSSVIKPLNGLVPIIVSSSNVGDDTINPNFISPFKEVKIIEIGSKKNVSLDGVTDDQSQSTSLPIVSEVSPTIPPAAVTAAQAAVAVTAVTEEGGAEEDEDEDEDEDAETGPARVARAKAIRH